MKRVQVWLLRIIIVINISTAVLAAFRHQWFDMGMSCVWALTAFFVGRILEDVMKLLRDMQDKLRLRPPAQPSAEAVMAMIDGFDGGVEDVVPHGPFSPVNRPLCRACGLSFGEGKHFMMDGVNYHEFQ